MSGGHGADISGHGAELGTPGTGHVIDHGYNDHERDLAYDREQKYLGINHFWSETLEILFCFLLTTYRKSSNPTIILIKRYPYLKHLYMYH